MTDGQAQQSITLDLKDLRDLYFFLGQISSIATNQRDELKPRIIELMGEKTELVTPDGWTFQIQERISTEYDKTQLRLVFDADQMDVILKPDTKAVAKLSKELGVSKEKLSELERGKLVIGTTKALKLNPPTKANMEALRK